MKAPHKVVKEGTKKEDPSMNQKNKIQSGSQKVTNMFQSPHQSQETYMKGKEMRNLLKKKA
jgi:uncharacterized protein with ATP-grasp and redox domains